MTVTIEPSTTYRRFVVRNFILSSVVTLMLAVHCQSARAQGVFGEEVTLSPAYRVQYYFDRQDSYSGGNAQVFQNGKKRWVNRRVRFLNFDYTGPAREDFWHAAFVEAARHHQREGL